MSAANKPFADSSAATRSCNSPTRRFTAAARPDPLLTPGTDPDCADCDCGKRKVISLSVVLTKPVTLPMSSEIHINSSSISCILVCNVFRSCSIANVRSISSASILRLSIASCCVLSFFRAAVLSLIF